MHVRINEAWHGKVHKQSYKLSGAQYTTSCILTKDHIQVILCDLVYVPNNIKC